VALRWHWQFLSVRKVLGGVNAAAVPTVAFGAIAAPTRRPYYSANATSGGGMPASSSEKESQHEDESIDGHGRWCSGSLGRWCYVDRTIGLGW
jgi:hypothetical protein